MDKPSFLPNVPGFFLKIILGEKASLVLGGNRVSSKKITDAGFDFKFDKVEDALYNIIKLNVA
jgi:NAD dependent epimerase/dehydratase family enzyme